MRSRALTAVGALLLIGLAVLLLVRMRQAAAPESASGHESAIEPGQARSSGQEAALHKPRHDSQPDERRGEAGFVAAEGRPPDLRRRFPSLTVLAVDRSTDEPLPEAVVALHETQRATSGNSYEEEITAVDGSARFELRTLGHYYVSVSCEGYLIGGTPFQHDSSDGDAFKKISLIPAFTLRGRVRNQSGQPLSQAEVSFSVPGEPVVVAESGAGGVFEVVLQAGRYKVTAEKYPHLPVEIDAFEVGPGRSQQVEIVIRQQAERVVFSGRILDRQGQSVARARISLTDLGRPPKRSPQDSVPSSLLGVAATDLQGRFRLETVPRPHVQVQVQAWAFEPVRQSIGLMDDVEKEFRLKPYPTFMVRAVSASGEQLPIATGFGTPGLEVVGVNADGQEVIRPVVRSGSEAEASNQPLFYASQYPFEIYAFDRKGQHGITGSVHIGAHRSEITLVADQPARLQGHVSDRTGKPVRQFVVTYRSGLVEASRLFESAKGEFEFLNLPEGDCTIEILSPEFEDYSSELVLQSTTPAFLEAVVTRRQGAGS